MTQSVSSILNSSFVPIGFTEVKFDGGFWSKRMSVNREATIPIQYQQCKETGRIDAFRLQWKPGQEPVPHIFWDSDVAKWIEAASYSLSTHADAKLEALLDEVIALIASAQQADGYLNTHYTQVEPEKRWKNLRDWHELYCAGHLIEAAVAHFQATGKRSLLDVMCRYSDYIGATFGIEEGKKRGYCGHEEIELALIKLHHATSEQRYLKLAQYFIDERGRQPHYFEIEAKLRGESEATLPHHLKSSRFEYNQSHLPVREQTHIVGHAVRAMYLYCAMADLACQIGDESLFNACKKIWDDLIGTKMYLTGGIGNSKHNEGFTRPFDLPNDTAYCETCAAIGLVFWAHRLLQLECDARYADVMERALYNGVISGVSLDGTRFFYENPLASHGSHHRQAWFGCACCPPNAARLLASLGQYVYSQRSENEIAVHLYAQGQMQTKLSNDALLTLRQRTDYPWSGRVVLTMELNKSTQLQLRLRIPAWCRSHTLAINGKRVDTFAIERGYAVVSRTWQNGDEITLDLAMPVEMIESHPEISGNIGRVALQRGPMVYCLEQTDHTAPVRRIALPATAELSSKFVADLLDGVVVLQGKAREISTENWNGQLYRPMVQHRNDHATDIFAVPYFAWDNRSPGEMAVWLARGT